jgi:hypothetical protein
LFLLFKARAGEPALEATGDRLRMSFCLDRLQRPYYPSRIDHDRIIRSAKQKIDIGRYSFVNRTIQLWNELAADA